MKLATLRQCMVEGSEAELLIRGLAIAPENFTVAWKILTDEFEMLHRAIELNVNALFDLQAEKKDDVNSLCLLKGEFNRRYLTLKALKEPVGEWESILVGLLKRKLQALTLREVEKDAPDDRALTVEELLGAISKRLRVLSTISSAAKQQVSDTAEDGKKKVRAKAPVNCKVAGKEQCGSCGLNHSIIVCPDFRKLSVNERYTKVREKRLCFRCLASGHSSRSCMSDEKSRVCDRHHHFLLHYDKAEPSDGEQECGTTAAGRLSPDAPPFVSRQPKNSAACARPSQVVRDREGCAHFARALLDSGSQPNFITSDLLHRRRLKKKRVDIPVNGVGRGTTRIRFVATAAIESRVCDYRAEIDFLVIKSIISDLPNYTFATTDDALPEGVELADPQFFLKRPIDMLLGVEAFLAVLGSTTVRLCSSLPPFRDSTLGLIFAGRVDGGRPEETAQSNFTCALPVDADLHEALERLWREQEVPDPEIMLTKEEQECEGHFRRTVTRQEDGRYIVELPLRSDPSVLGDSKTNAVRQFLALERRLAGRPEWEKYVQFMDEYFDLDHMELVNETFDSSGATFHIPHHAVTSAKFRVVFNASKKTAADVSLNDLTRVGPVVQADLSTIVNRFREHRSVQRAYYKNEIAALDHDAPVPVSSSLPLLNPFIDENGIVRFGGQMRHADASPDAKCPIVLPRQSHFTETLVRHEHQDGLHAPTQALYAKIRQRYWVPGLHALARRIVRSCVPCFRVKPRLAEQIMGQLPIERVQPAHPFANCGVVFCGPFEARPLVRSKASLKMYLAIFVCFATKAVHIELVPDLSAEAMIATLHRFASRRSRPLNIFSDNATNFVGAEGLLKRSGEILKPRVTEEPAVGKGVMKLSARIEDPKIADAIDRACTDKGIQWHFIPANSPHFGGLWEAAVGRAKYHIHRVLEEFAPHTKLNYVELETLAVQVEATLKSRPLVELTGDPNDLAALTPGHFLVGRPLNSIISPDLIERKMNHLTRWEVVQRLAQEFWRHWSREYVVLLQERRKWQRQRPNLQVGDLVLIAEDNVRPQNWRIGRIEQVYPDDEGVTRAAQVKTAKGVFRRAIARLVKIPVESCPDPRRPVCDN